MSIFYRKTKPLGTRYPMYRDSVCVRMCVCVSIDFLHKKKSRVSRTKPWVLGTEKKTDLPCSLFRNLRQRFWDPRVSSHYDSIYT